MFNDPRWLAPPQVLRQDLPGGAFVLRSPDPLQPYARCTGEWLGHWARETPDALAFAERAPDGTWRRLSWKQAREQVGRVAQALLDLKLPAGDPVVILSDNSLDHLLLIQAALHIGRPVCTVSSAYSKATRSHEKIHGILKTLGPALIYADNAQVYGPAITASGFQGPVVLSHGAADWPGARAFSELLETTETPAVQQAFEAIDPDAHAKYLLTSGSTGHPKVVINTHRMMCANQQMMVQTWRFLAVEKPVIVDWLPWSHTFGGNHNMNIVLCHGGTLVIDEGRPAPGLIEKSVRNLAEMQPTLWFNVPRGFDMALPLLEADEDLARRVLARMRMVFYAGAALPQATWARLQALARKVRGEEVWLTTSWGATETSPAATAAYWRLEQAGVIGLPLPGLEVKFMPQDGKLELRVRGVNIFPGYRHAPELTAQAFDEEGYYRIGDAGYLLDEQHPEKGIVFNGRVAEDFKLTTGTWVSVGTLRLRVISALSPLAQDVVITGHDRHEIGVLVFPTPAATALAPQELQRRIGDALAALKAQGGGSSQTPVRALVLSEPPSVDAGEITDKGYINQRAVLACRASDVERLHAGGEGVILPTEKAAS